MARTLIIKNADFSVNKLATVEIEIEVPCTGITLDKSTSAITAINGTDALTATPAPSGTTDIVVWSTSNADVATVAGGVVTAVGCGTATITATCGSYSATCAVTVTHVASGNDLIYTLNMMLGQTSGNDYINGTELANYAQGYSAAGTTILYYNSTDKYPYVIPKGANKIEITGTDIKAKILWLSSTATGTGGRRAKAYPLNTYGSAYNATPVSATIPSRAAGGDYDGMDAVGFSFSYTGGTISDEVMEGVTVTFTA